MLHSHPPPSSSLFRFLCSLHACRMQISCTTVHVVWPERLANSCFSDCSSKYQFHCSVSSWQTWHKMLTLLFHGSADAKSFQSTYSVNIAEQQFLLWAQTYMAYLMYAYCYCFTLLGHVCFCCIWFSFFSVLCSVIGWEKPAWNNLFVPSFAVYSFRFFALLFTEWKCAVFIATSVLWM